MGAAKMREGQRANNQKAPWEGLQTGAWETFSTQDCPLPWKVFFNIMGQILRNETKQEKSLWLYKWRLSQGSKHLQVLV